MQMRYDLPLSSVLWYKIGGRAKFFLLATTREEILEALEFVKRDNLKHIFICGMGSNLIFPDTYFEGAVLQIAHTEHVRVIEPDRIQAFAGASLDTVIGEALSNHLVGLEWAGGLPGTVGGAVRGNVGAFGGEIKDVVAEIEVIDTETLEFKTLTRDELHFSYRNSLIKQQRNLLIVSATFQLRQGYVEEVEKAKTTYEQNIAYRKTQHPLEYPNCGSVFKNISRNDEKERIFSVWPEVVELSNTKWHGKVSMGYLIKRLGFSGYQVGNAQVSEKHANFIVNLGGAKAADVTQIISEIQNTFVQTFGFSPEVEVEIVQLT